MAALTPQKSNGEQNNTIFSYAQAAKGRSPSVPHNALDVEKPTAKRTASEGQAADVEDFKAHQDFHAGSPTKTDASKTPPPSSAGCGTPSTSTVSKDDPFTTQNGSSESTWDKQSQTSQNGAKEDSNKADAEKREKDTTSWADDTPAPASLRDAPPPAVNFWEQRKELMQAKVKAIKPVAAQPTKNSDMGASSNPHNGPKGIEIGAEAKRPEGQKKAKNHPASADGKFGQSGSKDGSKANDGKSKVGAEGQNRNIPKVARTAESTKSSAPASAPLPPSGDAISWPTPDSAQDEEKKRSQERADKTDKDKPTIPKPSSKKEWTPLPFVPSAVFSTPIPQSRRGGGGRPNRGGREAGTGRGGTGLHNGNGAERSVNGAQDSVSGQSMATANENNRGEPNETRQGFTGSKSKRSVSAGPPTLREHPKASESLPSSESRKEAETKMARANGNKQSDALDSDRISISTQTRAEGKVDPTARASTWDAKSSNGTVHREEYERGERRPSGSQDMHAHPKSAGAEKRHDLPTRPVDHGKDFYGMPARERSEVHRGRGGYRNKNTGGHAFTTPAFGHTHSLANGQNSNHQPSTMTVSKSQSTHERHPSQSVSYVQSQPHSRSYRSGSRSQSITHPGPPYGRYVNPIYTGSPNLPSIQTDVANAYGYQPGHQGVMSAMTFPSFAEQTAFNVFSMVSMQMEYYFSVDNLCKDMYLRKHMDSQGFVFLSVLLKFNRMKQLTQDVELIKYVCLQSPNIEIRTGADGIDRLRKKDGWDQWVVAMEERDPSAQNNGPNQVERPRLPQPPMLSMPYGYDGVSDVISQYNTPSQIVGDGSNRQNQDGARSSVVTTATAPIANGSISGTSVTETPLSAAVPDFTPNLPQTNGQTFSSLDASSHNTSSFTDEQVDSLMIVVRKPNPTAPPFTSASSRTFSNGSIDGRTLNEELLRSEECQSRPKVNGSVAPDLGDFNFVQRSRSPFKAESPRRPRNINASPVFWVKDKSIPSDSLPNDVTHESYHVFRANALQQRDQSACGICHRDMDILYQFWSHFLIRNFNARMYEEFRRLSLDDISERNSPVGIKNLVQYYDQAVRGDKVVSDEIAQDFVDLVNIEDSNQERPAFTKLRSAWRNGATNMKNRKKIDNIIDAELKARLER